MYLEIIRELRMKVLVIVPDEYSYGGTGRFLERLLEIHYNNNIETALLVSKNHLNESYLSLAIKHGATILTASNKTQKNTNPIITFLYDFIFPLRVIHKWHPDLVVISTAEPGRLSALLFFPIPLLYILHTAPDRCFRRLSMSILYIGFMFNNRLMTVSNAAANIISRTMGVPIKKISVVYNSCNSINHEQKVGHKTVLTVGHIVGYKNPYVWLKVAQTVIKQRDDITFIWVGDGELIDDIRNQVNALGLDNRITLPGYSSNLNNYYEKSQVYFQPSFRESHGIAVLEAMSFGLPCVVSDIGGLPESVDDNETGFVCSPEDVIMFSDKILELLGNDILREKMGTAGRIKVREIFSEAEQDKKIRSIYELLVNKG